MISCEVKTHSTRRSVIIIYPQSEDFPCELRDSPLLIALRGMWFASLPHHQTFIPHYTYTSIQHSLALHCIQYTQIIPSAIRVRLANSLNAVRTGNAACLNIQSRALAHNPIFS